MYDYDPTRPKWEQIAEVLRDRISSGGYPPKHKLSEVQLEAEFDVARDTVRKAVRALRAEGLVVTRIGMGSFVAGRPETDKSPA
ncbi:GntR family transcriptional regulator [Streptomyces sp. NPDC092296]|uniref:GntR family transcriptional regulator n=1 Tax=Streptomyces sp. NPDC092296 TaxID=3366012 RepID=UPI00382D5D4D